MAEINSSSEKELCFTPAIELRDMIRNKLISVVEVAKVFLDEGVIADSGGL